MSIFSDIWNAQPLETRKLMSGMIMKHDLRNIKIIREMVVRNHKRTLTEIDAWVANLEKNLKQAERELTPPKDTPND